MFGNAIIASYSRETVIRIVTSQILVNDFFGYGTLVNVAPGKAFIVDIPEFTQWKSGNLEE